MLEVFYKEKCVSPDDIAAMIPDGAVVFTDIALAEPREILAALGRKAAAGTGPRMKIHTILDLYPMSWLSDGCIDTVTWFSSAGAKKAVNSGLADIMPAYYRDFPEIMSRFTDTNVFCVAVSPVDEEGYFSLGPTGSVSPAAIKKAEHIFLEVNDHMPRAVNGVRIHISEVEAFCEASYELPSSKPPVLDEISISIGNLIAERIPDGSVIQLGIGAIPDAVGLALKDKKHLGIHTELMGETLVDLVECGAADNTLKPIHTGKSVTTFAFGSKKVYDFVDGNPDLEVLPVDYVNDPKTIAKHPNFMSINSAVEVDFFGQVCAESVGTLHLSGSGGQADYVRGAVESPGGISFIAFPSTAQGGKLSRIRSALAEGAIVTTSKNDVDMIVTEYGIAELRGRTVSERTRALISIAHPKFREELTFAAKQRHIL